MNILIVAPYILLPNYKEFSMNTTGLGIMVETISSSVSSCSELNVKIFTNIISDSKKINGYEVFSHTIKDLILNFKLKYLLKFIRNFIVPSGTKNRFKSAYYAINSSYLEKLITEWADIVHFHDFNYLSVHGMDICEKKGKKFILTLHTLPKDSHFESKETQKWESIYIPKILNQGCIISVISSEMKEKILDWYDIENEDLVQVILNTTDLVTLCKEKKDIRRELNIPSDCKIIMCAGFLSARKNQIQLVKAFKKMSRGIQEKTYLLLIGGKSDKDLYVEEINKLLETSFLKEHIILTGYVSHDRMLNYYEASDANAVVSIKEPFGLPYIEAMNVGIPTLTFNDIGSTKDVCFPETSLCLDERSDSSLAEGMTMILNKYWDREIIKRRAEDFSVKAMGQKYVDCYNELFNEGGKKWR